MARLREEYKLKNIAIDQILPEEVPLDKSLKKSLFNGNDTVNQFEEVKVVELDEAIGDYIYKAINGRRRIETLRSEGIKTVRAIVRYNVTEEELHLGALHGNASTSNHADEAIHIKYLYDNGYTQEEISKKLGKGFSIGTVNNRLKLIQDLIPDFFQMLKVGEINATCAFELTRLNKTQQSNLLKSLGNKKPTTKIVKEAFREVQSQSVKRFEQTEEVEETKPIGLFITASQFEEADNEEVVEIIFDGKLYILQSSRMYHYTVDSYYDYKK